MIKKFTGRMYYETSETGYEVIRAHIDRGKLAIDWKEQGYDGGLVATSEDGSLYRGTYLYETSKEHGTTELRLEKQKDGSVTLQGHWIEESPEEQGAGTWRFVLVPFKGE